LTGSYGGRVSFGSPEGGNSDGTSQIKVLAGFTALSTATSSDRLDIDTVLVNPSFNPFTLDHDTALLRLTKHYELDKYLGIERRANIDGLSATIIGWGYPSERYTQLSDKLKAATVGIVSNNTCQGAYNYYNFKILPSMLCAIGNEVDACGGDSGGPLLTVYNKATVSTGVTSFGVGCSRDHMYGGYARTSSAYPWLAATSSLSSKFTSGLIFSSATFSSLNVRICSSNLAGRNVYLQMYRLATATTPQQLVNTYRAARPDAGCIDFYNIDGDETMLENAEYYIIASLYPLNPYEAKKMQKECYLISNNTRLCSYTKNAPLTIRPLPLPTLPPPGFEPPSSLM